MSTEWYLLKDGYGTVSGFEDDAIEDYGAEAFAELLETDVAETVEIANYDLSERFEARVVVQNNLQDTRLKTLNRIMLCPIGTCHAGMYVYYRDKYWLITGLVDNNGVYEKAIMMICNWLLSWIDDDGDIHQRWVCVESASQYNNGETNNKFYFIRTDQVMVYMPDDDISLMLNSGKRFIIDRRCDVYERTFSSDVECDTSKPVIVYDITRTDSVLYNYQESGYFQVLMTQCEQHETDGYYVVDGTGYWLCDKPNMKQWKYTPYCAIEGDSDTLYIGIEPIIYEARFYNANGEITSAEPQWSIEDGFSDQIEITTTENAIILSASPDALANQTFSLILTADGFESATKEITIKYFI